MASAPFAPSSAVAAFPFSMLPREEPCSDGDDPGAAHPASLGFDNAEPSIVMADSNIVRNVESPLARSVVELSTTEVDADKTIANRAATGETNTTSVSITIPSSDQVTNSVGASLYQNKKHADNPIAPLVAEEERTVPDINGLPEEAAVGITSDEEALNNTQANVQAQSKGLDHKEGVKSTGGEHATEAETSRSSSPTKLDALKSLDRKPSVKKASFKPVSLNKQFLKDATPSTGTPPTSLGSTLQPGKVSTSLSSSSQAAPRVAAASKLKLVRTAGPSQVSRPGSTGAAGNPSSSDGPVWNKNRPTPPPATKTLTDEELKKQYGIHLTSRLGPDDTTNKEAKWADIDDDDDDWVPEAIEWGDGTKSTLHTEDHSITGPVEPPKPEPDIQKDAATTVTVSQTPPASIAKPPMASASLKLSTGSKTLVTEKAAPKPVPTSAVPSPRPSPWAKISLPSSTVPIAPSPPKPRPVEPVHQEDPLRATNRVREVSAEGFERSWRDRGPPPGNRELFNSETGQLEPVQESRNKGLRPGRVDQPISKPAVLQRPPGPPPPAEPSPAFQQHRSSVSHQRPEDYRRRRTSSNVSGGSGSFGRRLSFSRYGTDHASPHESGFPRNQHAVLYTDPFDEAPPGQLGSLPPGGLRQGPPPNRSPRMQYREISPTMASASLATQPPASTQHVQPAQPTVEPEEDPIAKQERIMRESRELARKRRQEEEEREEAAKRERLRVKLEQLERAEREKKEREEAARRAEEERIAAEKRVAEQKRVAEEKAAAEERRKRLAEEEARRAAEAAEAARVAAAAAAAAAEREREQREREQQQQQRAGQAPPATASGHNPPAPALAPHTANPAPDRFTHQPPPFVRSRSPPSSSNPAHPHHPHSQPAPHSRQPPHPSYPAHPSPSTLPPSTASHHQPGDLAQMPSRSYPRPFDSQPASHWKGGFNNAQFNQQKHQSGRGGQQMPWGVIGDRSRRHAANDGRGEGRPLAIRPTPEPLPASSERATSVNAWIGFANNVQADEEADRQQRRLQNMARKAEDAANGVTRPPAPQPQLVETWKVTKVDAKGNRSFVDYQAVSIVSETPGDKLAAANGASCGLQIDQETHDRLPSPPPPMSADHPVHGDIKPSVVLPPAKATHSAPLRASDSSNGGHKSEFPRPSQKPSGVDAFEAVQQKILGMTQNGHSSRSQPHVNRSKDFSATKTPLNSSPERVHRTVTVSLPRQEGICTKPSEEEFLRQTYAQDFGSTPVVNIPYKPQYRVPINTVVEPASVDSIQGRKRTKNSQLQTQSAEIFNGLARYKGDKTIVVHLPGGTPREVPARAGVGGNQKYSSKNGRRPRFSKPNGQVSRGYNGAHYARSAKSGPSPSGGVPVRV